MSELTEATAEILQANSGAPFLFVGSGFSRRYLGLEDWSGLLRRFCGDVREFDYYSASANGNLPEAAHLLASDFHHVWWENEKYASSREQYKAGVKSVDDALKNEIASYLRAVPLEGLMDEQIQKEITALRDLNVDGIITTNWDLLIEELFPEYRTFVGQEELLFSNPQAIAEIYKIHGCSTKPSSLVLTTSDYAEFEKKNPYLAAKLITLFIEHPIFFIGYSVNDPHIRKIIFSIASCLSSEKLDQFSQNLIFLRRANGKKSSVQKLAFSGEGKSFTATVLETDDFCEVYAAIDANKRKIPARVLRYCKEQMYELVKSAEPGQKLAVIDIDELDDFANIEFVVGIGVAAEHQNNQDKIAIEGEQLLAEHGYVGIRAADLFSDILQDQSRFDPDSLLTFAFPTFAKSNSTFVPVYRYLREVGITNAQELAASKYQAAAIIVQKQESRGYKVASYKNTYDANWADKTTVDIISNLEPQKVALYVAFQHRDTVDRAALKEFLVAHVNSVFRDTYQTFFRKLVCYYDWLEYGF